MLLNRIRELAYFDTRYATKRAELVVLYGRRRVGKTSLVYHWVQDKPHLFYFATDDDSATLLFRFSQEIERTAGRHPEPDFAYPDWENALKALGTVAREMEKEGRDRLVIVIDEFPRVVAAYPPFASYLQMVWDMELQHTNIFIVLTGSLMSVMDQQVLAHEAPLYLRYTWPYELKPLVVADLPAFFPKYTSDALVETYAIFGGIPYNLVAADANKKLLTNVRNMVLEPTGSLFNEIPLQLHLDMHGLNIISYMSILRSIAHGAHTRAEITQAAGMNGKSLAHNLDKLQELGYIEARKPLERARKAQNRWARYHIKDPFLRFWQRYVGPRQSELEINHGQDAVWHQIRLQLPQIVAPVWEQIARWHLLSHENRGSLPIVNEVGSWWNAQAQIDVVGVDRNTRTVVFGEVRWRQEPFGQTDLDRLIDRGAKWIHGTDAHWDIHYAIYTRNITASLQSQIELERSLHLFTPEDVVAVT